MSNSIKKHEDIKVLVVDDSVSMLHVLEMILGRQYTVRAAADGDEGVEVYEAFAPDIIVLDMHMPKKSGLEVIAEIRDTYEDKEVIIIVLTADDAQGFKARALNAGANDFLAKPFDKEELIARVGVAARQVLLNRELRLAYEQIAGELDLVASLQRKLLPVDRPNVEGLRIESMYRPSGLASGDYYDFFCVRDNVVRFVVADVSGHGARAAFLMAVVNSLFRVTMSCAFSLEETFRLINEHLLRTIRYESDFISIFAADIDCADNSMTYINAGHCPALLSMENTVTPLQTTCPVLGFFELDFGVSRLELSPGSDIFLFTDGWYEWRNEDGTIYGLDAFMELASNMMTEGTFSLDGLMAALPSGESEPLFRDDVTALRLTLEAV
ncbi:PP2C family protein-serine/threonine phosphatase [Desulfovibrio inopinatus]|uniref:PP2C family protein-serine/threonine phosphatase n=1 Tax=Desulfovibrio inopinatus TaxID=102109 RepID=UPI0004228FE1|nr:SpoIIE family protein phosphatase [Desulfovibrio inopinatus]